MEIKVEQGIEDGEPEHCCADPNERISIDGPQFGSFDRGFSDVMDEETQGYDADIDDVESLDEEVVLLSRHFVQQMFNAWMAENAMELLKKSYEKKPTLKRKMSVTKK